MAKSKSKAAPKHIEVSAPVKWSSDEVSALTSELEQLAFMFAAVYRLSMEIDDRHDRLMAAAAQTAVQQLGKLGAIKIDSIIRQLGDVPVGLFDDEVEKLAARHVSKARDKAAQGVQQ